MEAERCWQCARPQCVDGCSVGVQIPEFIKALRDSDKAAAVQAMKAKNNLPALSAGVCPSGSAVRVTLPGRPQESTGGHRPPGALRRRFLELRARSCPPTREPAPARKWPVGSGPSGLTCAVDLARLGHSVTIFESLQKPGWRPGVRHSRVPLAQGRHPTPRLSLLRAAWKLTSAPTLPHRAHLTIGELLQEFDAVFMGTGRACLRYAYPRYQL